MTDLPDPSARGDEAHLHELLVQLLDLVAERGHEAATAFLQQHPAEEPELRRRLAKLEAAGLLAAPVGVGVGDGAVLPERLGDFRLVRPLGAGGMGIVYLAVQESLGREVALKLVRPEQLFFPGARERFQREVEAIARLRDPGIVGVHVVGEESGIPYFAMELVVGATLAELVLELAGRAPQQLRGPDMFEALRRLVPKVGDAAAPEDFSCGWSEMCAKVLAQIARAVAHAHAHGVLHRDLKSGNAMLRPDGRVVVLDFGLAQSRGASRLTRTGVPIGTLHAMAPEQLRGERDEVDERTDVYALGVLFYELLTLRPPFLGDSYDTVARRILDANPPAPSRVNPAVPWEYETVCLTAMEQAPSRRYPSARALLRDLENLIARRPIEARRPSTWLRLRRFGRRHRALTTATAVVLLALLALPVVIAVRESSLNATLSAEMARTQAAMTAAAAALQADVQGVLDEQLDQVPDLREMNQRLAGEVVRQIESLLEGSSPDAVTRLQFAETLYQAGVLRWSLHEFELADTQIRRALELLDPASGARASCPDRFDGARLEIGLGLALLHRRESTDQQSEAELRQVLAEAERGGGVETRPLAFRIRFADGLERLAALASVPRDEAVAAMRRALALREGVAAESPDQPSLLALAQSHRQLAAHYAGRDEAAAKLARGAEEAALLRAAAHDGKPRSIENLAMNLRMVSQRAFTEGRTDDAFAMLRRSIELLDQRAEGRSSRIGFQVDRLSQRLSLAWLLWRCGRHEERIELLREVVAGLEVVVAAWPGMTMAMADLISARRQLYDEELAMGDHAAAGRTLAQLGVEARRAVEQVPERALLADSLASVMALEAAAMARDGQLDAGRERVSEAQLVDRDARIRGREERVSFGVNEELMMAIVEIALADGQTEYALRVAKAVRPPVDFDPLARAPRLREVAGQEGFAEWLAEVRWQ